MNPGQSPNERIAQFGGALNAALAGSSGPVRVEAGAKEGVGELRAGSTIIHFGLRPLCFKLVQDAGQLTYLFLIQVELVREKA